VNILESELQGLVKGDVILISGGTNDIDKPDGKVNELLAKMIQFILKYNNTNILIINLPHRHDLASSATTNSRIRSYNMKLKHFTQAFKHVSIVEMSSERNNYTRHGLHMNNVGKEKLARQIAYQIEMHNKRTNATGMIIPLHGREERAMPANTLAGTPTGSPEVDRLSTDNYLETRLPTVQTLNTLITSVTKPLLRVSSRNKRVPTNRTQDFLW
jgi:hypothetical protein